MKKKSIIIILLAAIVLMLTTYITTKAETTINLGSTKKFNYSYPGGGPTGGTNLTDVLEQYFCGDHTAQFGNSKNYTKKNVARAEIVNNIATVYALKGYSSSEVVSETVNSDNAKYANKLLTALFYKIKQKTNLVNKLDINMEVEANINYYGEDEVEKWISDVKEQYDNLSLEITTTDTTSAKFTATVKGYKEYEEKIQLTRKRKGSVHYGIYAFVYDYGQMAMWDALCDWKANVANSLGETTETSETILANIRGFLQSTYVTNSNRELGHLELAVDGAIAEAYGRYLYEQAVEEANNSVDNEYGIERTGSEIITREEDGTYTILGPFTYKFAGAIKNGQPTLTFAKDGESQSYTIWEYEGDELKLREKITSGIPFYIKVPTDSLKGVPNIHFNFQVEGISLYNTETTMYFYTDGEARNEYRQPVIYIEQEEVGNEEFEDTYTLSEPIDVSLEKLDISGNLLKAEGIKFQIKDNTNVAVAYFKTDENGNGIVTDAEGNPTGETTVKLFTNQTYTLVESENNYYGYKKGYLKAENIEISGAEIEQSDNNVKFVVKDEEIEQVTIKAKNEKELANLEIEKIGQNGEKLENVSFVIKIGSGNYLQLKDSEGKGVKEINKNVVINPENTANENEYYVEYVSDMDNATRFITTTDGKIVISNLEVNRTSEFKYWYTACEVSNPNYGYGSEVNTTITGSSQLKLNETNTITIKNTQALGSIKLKKYDSDNQSVVLPNVGFAIEIAESSSGKFGYLVLYNEEGEVVKRIKETAVINSENVAKEAHYIPNSYVTGSAFDETLQEIVRTEYKVSYYYTDKSYKDLTEEEKANITIFMTGNTGILTVNNLEVYSSETGEKYTYKLIETSNPNSGYFANYQEKANISLTENQTVNIEMSNKIVFTEIAGYVWLENPEGKANEYDSIYTENGNDKKLTDLYILENGELIKNPNAETPVEIKLRNKQTGEIIKELPDEFDGTGKYTFTEVFNDNLANYEVVFKYNGFYYTAVDAKLGDDNGSKVNEVASERIELNNKFASVEDNSQVISTDGTINTVEYNKNAHTSNLTKLNFDTTVSANTSEANYNLDLQALNNVNMGIVLREQPKISINSDIYSALMEFEGYKYNYKYNGRHNYYENVNGDDIGVKFEQEYTFQRYTRTVYASDIQAAVDFNKEIKLSITYKIQIANQSKTLNVMPKQIINYFDSRYEIQAIGLGLDETNHTITDTLGYSTPQEVDGLTEYKSTIIDFKQLIGTESNVKDLYITFNVSREAIVDLLNKESTYHNASEIISYATYYSEETVKTEKTGMAGQVYAGIDKMSQPGNAEIKLVDHPDGGTQIIDTTNFEDDTTSAPSLILEAEESRIISGTIWEDKDANPTDNERLGNGIFDEGENVIKEVKVQLREVNADGTIGDIAKYSNGEEASTKSDENGNYKLGYYDETTKKYVGILPGKYVIQFTYNNEAYIMGKHNINVNDYKSTIIASDIIKNAFNNNDGKWYITEESNRYSDARDDISLRKEYANANSSFAITNSTYASDMEIDYMKAYTPVMDISIEFTEFNESDVLTLELLKEFKNIDFGVIERPRVDISIEKQITGLEIVAQNGTSIIPHGNPSDLNSKMQYVKKLPGRVSAEIEADLLQGAELKLEYTITVANNSEKDYLEADYYYYGIDGRTELTTRAKQVADYISGTLTLDSTANAGIWTETTAQDLYNNGLLSNTTKDLLSSGNYNILTTHEFENIGAGDEKSVKLYASKYLAISDSTNEENIVEIIELTGIRTITDSIPGNYEASRIEPDTGKVDLVITPPTGTKVNYVVYIMAGIVTAAILVVGIVIIKKKLIK